MIKLFLYVVAANSNPDQIGCSVPAQIDKKEIFFGPCKKRLREQFRNSYLNQKFKSIHPKDEIYIVGVNGANKERNRKILWAGKINKIMTFEHAFHKLQGGKYEKMRKSEMSPVHVMPIYHNGLFKGYRHINSLHKEKDSWIMDLVNNRYSNNVKILNDSVLLNENVMPWEGFPRDCCFLLENIFFAKGEGISLTNEAVQILQKAQPKRKVDEYAVFGYKKDKISADGRAGSFLYIKEPLADDFITWIKKRRSSVKREPGKNFEAKCCN